MEGIDTSTALREADKSPKILENFNDFKAAVDIPTENCNAHSDPVGSGCIYPIGPSKSKSDSNSVHLGQAAVLNFELGERCSNQKNKGVDIVLD